MTEDHPDAPDIYTEGLRPERCATCRFCGITELSTLHGVKRTEYTCERRADFIHKTQGEARCNYWEEQ